MGVQQRILIISDTHSQFWYLDRLKEAIGKIDLVYHLGDVVRDQEYIETLFECEVDMVEGNCDYFSQLPGEAIRKIGKHKAFLTHGHGYAVRSGNTKILQRAMDLEADIVMYGHTHIPAMDYVNGILLMNPGSISSPRQTNREHTYILMEVDENGDCHAAIHAVEELDS